MTPPHDVGEPRSSYPARNWKLRAGAAIFWLMLAVLGVITHAPITIAIGAGMALIYTYRARVVYTATHTEPRS